jgi:choline-sulfatase
MFTPFTLRSLTLVGFSTWGEMPKGARWRANVEYSSTICADFDDVDQLDCAYENGVFTAGYRYRGRVMGHSTDSDSRQWALGLAASEEGGRHWSEITADDTIGFISDAQSHHQPVFIYSAFNAPHDPRQAPQADLDRYPLERIRVPVSALPEYPYAEAMGAGRTLRDERLAPFPRTEQAIRTQIREYYALITHLDAQLGRIFAALEASGRAGRTWIFFTADNGLAVGRHGLMGKQSMYEHSLRVPFIVAGPRAAANRRIATPIYLQDAMATTLALANVPKPAALDFHSLLPLLEDPGHGGFYPDVYGAYLSSQRALVHKGYKLILYPGAKAARLFHLDQDPHEIHDLATAAAHQPTMRRLFARLLDQQRTLADPLDLSPLYPQWAPDPPARP